MLVASILLLCAIDFAAILVQLHMRPQHRPSPRVLAARLGQIAEARRG